MWVGWIEASQPCTHVARPSVLSGWVGGWFD